MKNWIIVGVMFVIVEVVGCIWVVKGYKFFLVGCDEIKFNFIKVDLNVCGVDSVNVYLMDVNDFDWYSYCLDFVKVVMGWIDGILIVYGILLD